MQSYHLPFYMHLWIIQYILSLFSGGFLLEVLVSVPSLPLCNVGTYHNYMYIMLALYIINLIKFVKIKLCKYESFF